MESALAAQGIPEHVHAVLLDKLANEVFDAGSVFSLAQDESGNFEVRNWCSKFKTNPTLIGV